MENILEDNFFKNLVLIIICYKCFLNFNKNNYEKIFLFLSIILIINSSVKSNKSFFIFVAILLSYCILKNEEKEKFFSAAASYISDSGRKIVTNAIDAVKDPIGSTKNAINRGTNILFETKDLGTNILMGNFDEAKSNLEI